MKWNSHSSDPTSLRAIIDEFKLDIFLTTKEVLPWAWEVNSRDSYGSYSSIVEGRAASEIEAKKACIMAMREIVDDMGYMLDILESELIINTLDAKLKEQS